MRRARETHTVAGPGLARGPALLLGTVLSGFGLAMFLKNGATPTGGFSDGTVQGDHFLGFETNGWTAWLTTTAGVLLLIGAAQHLLAKTMSLIVGIGLGAAAVIAFIDGDDVLGLAAANHWTQLGWIVAGALLLVNTLMPRVRHRDHDHDAVVADEPRPATTGRFRRGSTADPQPAATDGAVVEDGERVSSVRR